MTNHADIKSLFGKQQRKDLFCINDTFSPQYSDQDRTVPDINLAAKVFTPPQGASFDEAPRTTTLQIDLALEESPLR
jgi:hypothetical protein